MVIEQLLFQARDRGGFGRRDGRRKFIVIKFRDSVAWRNVDAINNDSLIELCFE
jgi:hypothetical protein